MINKRNNLQTRLTDEELAYIKKAHKAYNKANGERITRSEYVRRMLLNACSETLGVIEKKPEVKYDCACIEVHVCGKENK